MDYSKLTDEQLEAIARGDYSKLPDSVLKQIINENQVAPGATTRPADPPGFNRQAARDAGYTDEEIDGQLRNPPTEAGTFGQEAKGVGQIIAVPAAAALNYAIENPLTTAAGVAGAASYIPGVNKLPVIRDIKNVREGLVQRFSPTPGPVAPANVEGVISENAPSSKASRTVPVTGAAAPESVPINRAPAPTQAAGAVAPEAQAAAQAARTVAPEAGSIMSKVAPYLQQAGRLAAPVARVAGPAGMVASAYEAAPYLQQAEVGPRAASGEVGRMVKGANRMALNMPTPAPLSAQEARNLLASGDERTINIYGGRAKLQAIANPNAMNSGYAQELRQLGR